MIQQAPLILGPDTIAALHELRDRAAERPVDMSTLMETLKTASGKKRHMDRMTAQTIVIPGPWAFMVTFSVEIGHPCGTARHMSMSIDRTGRVPHPAALWMVAQELGFTGSLKDCESWPERLQGHGTAINVEQPVAVASDGSGESSDKTPDPSDRAASG